jgi:hypothetical protein
MKPKILSPHLMFHEVVSKGMPLHLTCTHHNRKTLWAHGRVAYPIEKTTFKIPKIHRRFMGLLATF